MDYESVKRAEVELHESASRRDRARVDALLHPDFVEIGRSGKLWSRAAMIDAMLAEEARPTPQADEWQFSEVSPGLVLVTYRLSRDGVPSRPPRSGTPRPTRRGCDSTRAPASAETISAHVHHFGAALTS